ncbi:hypothetical protein CC1G_11877 [Coprinopsis cinerea okayama7|uniref:Uncharacterized protein n=1 Tax=Coprinopsis cinerea (strain Okayama-7 / 130 / ATCC MYA-4618 / FGSC 9003) TaxID=240176 RepID=A8NJL7_COPC7|nr:hypothetical protein CC1G_11877 [Coprinopsis cinerea okayama7\|eukprot:XP_001834256.2 hypothetical protein CC1G_11877 [Coprinopsis cinerea okayama7\
MYTIKSFLHTIYARIVLSRTTTFFFVFSLIYCFTQGVIQSLLHGQDHDIRGLLKGVVDPVLANAKGNMTFVLGSPGALHLQICNDVPYEMVGAPTKAQPVYPCTTVFRSSTDASSTLYDTARTLDWSKGIEVWRSTPGLDIEYSGSARVATAPKSDNSTAIIDGVIITSVADQDRINLSLQCIQTLSYPKQILDNSKREDIALIMLQPWLWTISVLAVVMDSVPHLLTAIVTRTIVTAWSAFSLWRTTRDQSLFHELLAEPGTPCSLDLFTDYFQNRIPLQITDVVLSCTALIIFFVLTIRLLKTYSSHAFQCIGAPDHINRINKFFLALLSCLQLEVFALTTAMAMWIDVLLNTAIGSVTPLMKTYIAVFITTVLVLLPWIAMGWFATKREKRWMMAAFLFFGFAMLFAWLLMFYSIVYRWTFLQWPFLGCFTVSSLVLLIASFVLGVICRTQFGKGHAEYLRAEEALSSLNFTREVFTRNTNHDNFDLDPSQTTSATEIKTNFKFPFSPSSQSQSKPRNPTSLFPSSNSGSKRWKMTPFPFLSLSRDHDHTRDNNDVHTHDLSLNTRSSISKDPNAQGDRKPSLTLSHTSRPSVSIYYIQTLESDGAGGVHALQEGKGHKGPFGV